MKNFKVKMVVVEIVQDVPWGRKTVDEFDCAAEASAFLKGCKRARLLDLQEIRVSLQIDNSVVHMQADVIECMIDQLALVTRLTPWSSEQRVIDAFIAARAPSAESPVEVPVAAKPDTDGGYW
jgi:hypothetical protein